MKQENEIWKNVVGYEGLYHVSDFGNVKRLEQRRSNILTRGISIYKEKTLKPTLYSNGYLFVDLCKNGTKKSTSIHRIVAISFIQNPENKPQVNHKNGIKTDNRLENLEWNTMSENQKHSIDTGLRHTMGEKNSQSKLTEKDILSILNDNRPYKFISNNYRTSISNISCIKRGYSWGHVTGLKNKKRIK